MDFNAATEYDAVNNYKVLQAAFTKMGIDKVSYLYPFNAGSSLATLSVSATQWHFASGCLHASAWLPGYR